METKILLEKLIAGENLSPQETETFFTAVLEGNIDPIQIAGIITALRIKGETSEEILGFVRAMRTHMITVDASGAIDLCGTGGDGKGTFNISTAVSFVLCAAGVPVAKHGNKAVSSNSGSADVLEALDVNIMLSPEHSAEVFRTVGMVFLFAPLYHPAMKHVAGIRKSLGIRTVFNLLGPFSNPASVKRQVIGVPNKNIAATVAETATHLGYEHLLIVTSDDGLDEVSIFAPTQYYEIIGTTKKKKMFNPQKYGFGTGSISEILGSDATENAESLLEIFSGIKNAKRDIVVVNSAFALYAAGKVSTIRQGIRFAEKIIDSGKAQSVLEKLRKETQKYGK